MKRLLRKKGIMAAIAAAFLLPAIAVHAWERVDNRVVKQVTAEQVRENIRSMKSRNETGETSPLSGIKVYSSPYKVGYRNDENLLTRSASDPRGEFYALVPFYLGLETADDAYLGKFNPNNGMITPLYYGAHYLTGGDYQNQTAAMRGNYGYFPIAVENVFEYNVSWYVVDLTNGKIVETKNFGGDRSAKPYTMTYDAKRDQFITFSWNGDTYNQLTIFDGKTLNTVDFVDMSKMPFINAVCYNPDDEEVYLFDWNNKVYILSDPGMGRVDQVGDLSTVNNQTLFEEFASYPMCYSPKDRAFVTLVPDMNTQQTVLQYIDPESWDVDAGVTQRNSFLLVRALLCADQYAAWDAPEIPALPKITFSDSSLTGKLTFKASENQFNGNPYPAGTSMKTVVTMDDKSIFEGNMTPGEEKTIELDLTSGQHTAGVYCETSEGRSPVASKVFYVGYDNPYPVTNLTLDKLNLSWKAPKAGGVHNGYVNPDNITYDVYYNTQKINSRPITETSYTIYNPNEMALTAISVVAVANGMQSEPTVLNEIIGKAKELPVHIVPERSDLNIIKILDANGDNESFNFSTYTSEGITMLRHLVGYFNDPDEWIFLPRTNFPDSEKLYNLSLGIGGVYTGTTREDVDIYIGETATPEGMTTRIWNREQLGCPHIPIQHSINFAVPQAGEYYIGIHYHSSKDKNGRGLTVNNITISDTGKSSDVPGPVTSCIIKAEPAGNLTADLTVTLPVNNITGQKLNADQELTVYVECMDLEDQITTAVGKPGQTVTVSNVPAKKDGFNQFIVTAGNENGYGSSVSFQGYVGTDIAVAPKGIILNPHADNTKATMTWEKPSAIGINGGYVDADNLNYVVYYPTNGTTAVLSKITETKDLTATFSRPLSSMQQANFSFTVVAENKLGYDKNANFVSDILGKPYTLPMVEEYATTGFNYYPVMRNTTKGYNNVTLANVKDFSPYAGSLGGLPVPKFGAVYMVSDTGFPTTGQIMLPKASTKGIPSVLFGAAIWDYTNAPKVYITGRTSDDPQKVINVGEIPLKRGAGGEWTEEVLELPKDFCDKDWIQLYINTDFGSNPNEYLVLDRYSIKPNVDFDLQLYDMTAPSSAAVGESMAFDITLANSGLETNTGTFTLEILDPEMNRLAVESLRTPRMLSGVTSNVHREMSLLAEWADFEYIYVRATVEGSEDLVEANNSQERKILVVNNPLPVVTDLDGHYNDDHTAVTLTWSEPNLGHGDVEDMEYTRPFYLTDQIGLFRNVDMDQQKCFDIQGLTWPDSELPQAWTVINAKELGVMNDGRIYPHSGEQYILARALHYDLQGGEEAKQAADWLISPEVVPGSDISFWFNTFNSDYKEYVELWVSETDDELGDEITRGTPDRCGSFYKVYSFSKSGQETWEEVTWKLPAKAKYFALVYRSYDEIGALLDDIQFSPLQLAQWEIDHYSVFRHITKDGKEVIEDLDNNVKTTSLTKDVEDANASYFVRAFVKTPMGMKYGPLSNKVKLYSLGVDDLKDLGGIFGTVGAIIIKGHAGEEMALYSADGKYIRALHLTNDNQTIEADRGIYIVKAGNSMAKVLVR